MIKFEWDAVKANFNLKKHDVSFEEAQSVFYDEFARQFYDVENSDTEDRFPILEAVRREFFLCATVSEMRKIPYASFPLGKQLLTNVNTIEMGDHESRIRSFKNAFPRKPLCL